MTLLAFDQANTQLQTLIDAYNNSGGTKIPTKE